MHRRPIVTFDETGKAIRKDYLTYDTEFHVEDWPGNDLVIRENIVVVFKKPMMKVTTTLGPETGDHIRKKEYGGDIQEYYIELTDKNRNQVIQDIINKSNGSQYK